jgi:hypothetical protein
MVDRPPALSNRLGDNWYTVRRIAKLAGETWYGRAFAAAVQPAMTADTNITLALLDAIWRAFDETKRPRLHTANLLSELLDMDEGRWREARHGQPITAYYLRDNLGDMLPANADEIAPRRWREGSGNPQFGYDVLHLKDAFQRYLGKGLPAVVKESGAQKQNDAQKDQKSSDTSAHPTPSQESEDISETYIGSDVGRMLVSDQTHARDRTLAERKRRTAAQKRRVAVLDRARASDGGSDTKKHEQSEVTPGIGVGSSDVSDDFGVSCASSASEPSKHVKGAAGRKRRKT